MTLSEFAFRRNYIDAYLLSTLSLVIEDAKYRDCNVLKEVTKEFPGMTETLLKAFEKASEEVKITFYRENETIFSDSAFYDSACVLGDAVINKEIKEYGNLDGFWKKRKEDAFLRVYMRMLEVYDFEKH